MKMDIINRLKQFDLETISDALNTLNLYTNIYKNIHRCLQKYTLYIYIIIYYYIYIIL